MKPIKLAILVALVAAMFLTCGMLSGAEPPAIVATTAGNQLILTPTLPVGSGAVWRVLPGTKPGTWTLILVTASNGQPAILDGALVLTFGNSPVPPQPPNPPDPPQPVVKPVAVYLIYESKDLTPATAAVRDGLAWKKAAVDAGIRWLCLDQDQGKLKFPSATARAITAGLPAVVFVDSAGVPDVVKAPATAAEMEALVKQKGGK